MTRWIEISVGFPWRLLRPLPIEPVMTDLPIDLPAEQPAKAGKSRSRKPTAKDVVVTPAEPVAWTYEQSVAEIEAIVEQMESGDLDLATVFARFESAMGQLKRCKTFLQDKQEQVDLLLETLEDDVAF
jgi:exodeoxyribonuclease VII small subunit